MGEEADSLRQFNSERIALASSRTRMGCRAPARSCCLRARRRLVRVGLRVYLRNSLGENYSTSREDFIALGWDARLQPDGTVNPRAKLELRGPEWGPFPPM